MRIGFGYDSHRLEVGRALVIGGVNIPYEKGLAGHSDADVLCHAIIDALLGAAHIGNIGALFPDTDRAYRDANSLELLRSVAGRLCANGWQIANIDTVVVIEQPKIGGYVNRIEHTLANACGIEPDCVSVKPKTDEGMGPVGAGKGAVSYAVCLLQATTK